jgi:large subunit ribosomal protein L9
MEVILMDDVEALGHEGDVVRVADGYARNFLIPNQLAVRATKASRADLERRRGAIAVREAQKAEAATGLASELHQHPLVIAARSGEGGKLHGTVTSQQIADALAAQRGLNLDRRRIQLLEPIREVGDYLVGAELYKGVKGQLTIRVVAEGQEEEATAEGEAGETEAEAET